MFFSVLKNVIYRANESYLENMECDVPQGGTITQEPPADLLHPQVPVVVVTEDGDGMISLTNKPGHPDELLLDDPTLPQCESDYLPVHVFDNKETVAKPHHSPPVSQGGPLPQNHVGPLPAPAGTLLSSMPIMTKAKGGDDLPPMTSRPNHPDALTLSLLDHCPPTAPVRKTGSTPRSSPWQRASSSMSPSTLLVTVPDPQREQDTRANGKNQGSRQDSEDQNITGGSQPPVIQEQPACSKPVKTPISTPRPSSQDNTASPPLPPGSSLILPTFPSTIYQCEICEKYFPS